MNKVKLAVIAAVCCAFVYLTILFLSINGILPGIRVVPRNERNDQVVENVVAQLEAQITPELTIEATPEVTPEVTPELTPETTLEVTPEPVEEVVEVPQEETPEIPFIVDISKKKYLNVRTGPDKKSEAIGKLKKDDYGIVLEEGETFSYVQWGNLKGYVSNDCIIIGDEAQARIDALSEN